MSARIGQPPIVSLTVTSTSPASETVTAGHHAEGDDVGAELGVDDGRQDGAHLVGGRRHGGRGGAVRRVRSGRLTHPEYFTGRGRVISRHGERRPRHPTGCPRATCSRSSATTPATPSTSSWPVAARPLVTAEIAEMLGLHPNTVRPHLDRMREVGLLDVTTDARGEVGPPQHRYSLAADAPSLGLEPPTMPVLARMVLAMAERLDASPDDAVAVGEVEGAARAAALRRRPLGARGAGRRPRPTRLRPGRGGRRARRPRHGHRRVRQLPVRRLRRHPSRARLRAPPRARRRVRRGDGRCRSWSSSARSSTAPRARCRSGRSGRRS